MGKRRGERGKEKEEGRIGAGGEEEMGRREGRGKEVEERRKGNRGHKEMERR